jgi:hypothetical protein
LGLKTSGVAAAAARRGAAVSTVIWTEAVPEPPAAVCAVSSAVYTPSGTVLPPKSPSHASDAAALLPLQPPSVAPPESLTATRHSAVVESWTERSTASRTPSPLGLISALFAESDALSAPPPSPMRLATLTRIEGRSL